MDKLDTILFNISVWSVTLPFIAGLCLIKYLGGRAKIIWVLTAFATLPQMVRLFILDKSVKNVFYNLYTIIEVFLILFFFYTLLNRKRERKLIFLSGLLFMLVYLFFLMGNDLTKRFFNEIVCFDNLLYTTWALYILYKQFDQEKTIVNLKDPDFYFLVAILIYAPITVFIFSTWQYIHVNSSTYSITAKLINHLSNSFLYFLFAVGIIKNSMNNIACKINIRSSALKLVQ